MDQSLVRLGFMKGYVNHVVDGFVSYVNAQTHFERLGIPITESQDPGFQSFRSALKVIFHGVDGKTLAVGGIVFDEKYPRISLINDHYFEIDPSGSFVVIENMDRPGVVGHLGTFLANHNINIDSFELSRNRVGGTAMSLIKVDTAPSSQQIKEMSLIENVISVKSLKL
jgi:D-3-phosphoglycerate dehydrogenase